jgi:hypothetical protein
VAAVAAVAAVIPIMVEVVAVEVTLLNQCQSQVVVLYLIGASEQVDLLGDLTRKE